MPPRKPSTIAPATPGFLFFQGAKSEKLRQVEVFLRNSYPLAVAVSFAAAFLLPILTFAVIPAFAGRMAVVAIVAVGVGLAVVQAGIFGAGKEKGGAQAAAEGALVSGVYVGVMAVVAGIFG